MSKKQDHLDRVGKTINEILETRNHLIDQLAAAFSKTCSFDPDQVGLFMENTLDGVIFYFDLLPQFQVKH